MNALADRQPVELPAGNPTIRSFDATGRFWVTTQNARGVVAQVPTFDGTFVTDPVLVAQSADDFAQIIHQTPLAVLRPGSVDDVLKMVRFARQHSLRLAGRGNGHTAFGQSQVEAGVVIDLSSLNQIHTIAADHAIVDAGVVWRDLLLATTAAGLTPPVLTDYTLSVGGVSGRSYQHGAQVDNVLELQVVTAEGRLVTCSETKRKDLFDAVLAGLGQCAIIVRATIRLIPAKERAQTHRLFYADAPSMLADLRYLVRQKRFDYLRGNVVPSPDASKAFSFFIEATSFYTVPADKPADPLAGVRSLAGLNQLEDQPYFDFTDVVVQLYTALDAAGLGDFAHPWLDLFVPDSQVDAFALQTITTLDPATFLPGSLILFYPFVRSQLKRPLFRVPAEETFFLFDILRSVPPDSVTINAVLNQNRDFYRQNRSLGGTFYPISAVPLESTDWQRHFGPAWPQLMRAKNQYDPDAILPFLGR